MEGYRWGILAVGIAALALAVVASVYILLYWSKPDERWTEIPSRILAVFTLTFMFMLPIIISLEVSNGKVVTSGVGNTFAYVWLVLATSTIFLGLFLVPLCYFYLVDRFYNRTVGKALLGGLWKASIALAIGLVLSGITYAVIKSKMTTIFTDTILQKVGFLNCLILCCTFLSTIFYTLFLSIGLFIHPTGYIIKFIRRPHSLSTTELVKFKQEYKKRAGTLLQEYDRIYHALTNHFTPTEIDVLISNNERTVLFGRPGLRKEERNFEKLERDLDLMEKEYTETIAINIRETANPLKYFISLGFGVFLLLVSILWYSQIIAAKCNKRFLDKAYIGMDTALRNVPALTVVFYGAMAIHLMFCFVNGVTMLGLKFFFFIKIYPMERNSTPLRGFLFNCMLLLSGGLASVTFLAYVTRDYVIGTTDTVTTTSITYQLFYLFPTNDASGLKWWFENMYWFVVALAPIAVALWVTHTFVRCKCCKIVKRDPKEEEAKRKKKKEKDDLLNFSQKGPLGGGKAGMMLTAAKGLMGLNN
ncbi:hypothetical protein GMRT_15981 [Giardia muris]|uniref:LMBR1-like membrane protein n=1 Tax=Giardia muris TaxID=5742 RepID=A0A4Z1SU77_GIAMU|nr:hypothetical protein GMRT_15981 [Giardia muris]|eukprot:TNJ29404.1 hypothetical protein GMRT_15981 [Giardia muris]